jgi:hypothetical protein
MSGAIEWERGTVPQVLQEVTLEQALSLLYFGLLSL